MADRVERWEGLRDGLERARTGPAGTVPYIDSHTGGEPTRVLLRPVAAPDPSWPSRIVGEPRGSGILVGVALQEPADPGATARLHFFNNVGPLQMCVHATIGLVESLAQIRYPVRSGEFKFETEAGMISAQRDSDGVVAVGNVQTWWSREETVEVGGSSLRGDIVWAGNWFFLVHDPAGRIDRAEIPRLVDLARAIRAALDREGIRGADGAEIDHIHIRVDDAETRCRVLVLCPGGEYDRSPCGTGTSALTAVLAKQGSLAPGDRLRVRSAIGSEFEAEFTPAQRGVMPIIRGRAHVTGQGWLVFDGADPLRNGL